MKGVTVTATGYPERDLLFPEIVPERDNVPRTPGSLTEKDLVFLREAVCPLFQLPTRQAIFEFIAGALARRLEAVVIVSAYDAVSGTIKVSGVGGFGSNLDKVVTMLGRHPAQVCVPINDEATRGLSPGRLKRVGGGLYELATYSIPAFVCTGIEAAIGAKHTYAMGITWRDRIIGSVAILSKSEITDSAVVETFVNFAASAIAMVSGRTPELLAAPEKVA